MCFKAFLLSETLELVHKLVTFNLVLFILDFFFLHQFILCLHRDFSLKDVLHILHHGIVSDLVAVHDLAHHLVVYHHLVHLVIESIELAGHCLEVKVSHLLAGYLGQV